MKDETLLPCPFCGSPAEHYPDGDMEGYSITCSRKKGPCNMWAFGYETPEEAERAWNTRADLQSGNSAQPVTVPDGLITDEVINSAYEKHLYGIMCGIGNKRAAVNFLNECLASMRIKP